MATRVLCGWAALTMAAGLLLGWPVGARAQTAPGMTINGDVTAAAGGKLNVGNLALDGNTIANTDANGDINIKTNGDGKIGITNHWTTAAHGIRVDKDGKVGVGNMDELNSIQGYMQVGTVSPLIFGQNFLGFNSYYNGGFKYFGGDPSNRPLGAGFIGLDLTCYQGDTSVVNYPGGNMWICGAPAGSAGNSISPFMGVVVAPSGALGVGFDYRVGTPTQQIPQSSHFSSSGKTMLDVKGAIAFRNVDNTDTNPGGYIWSNNGSMYASDSSGDITNFSPHEDPRAKFPQAKTSFGDPEIALPFSMHHENVYIGKGAYVDMAKMIGYIEKKMQAELGTSEGQLVFVYDLPAERKKTAEDREVNAVLFTLEQMGPIKINLDSDGTIPKEAMEVVDEMAPVSHVVDVSERNLDLEAGRIVKTTKKKNVTEMVKTGRKTKRLKAGWLFKDGELYRLPTIQDVDLAAIARNHPKLPGWVLDRMKGGKNSGQSVSALIEELKKRLAAVSGSADPAKVVAAKE